MKFMINGALTIGTLDGANVEMREEVGAENFFLFGLTVPAVQKLLSDGYRPADYIAANPELAGVLGAIGSGRFSMGTPRCSARSSTTSPSTTRSWWSPTTPTTSLASGR